MSEYRLITGAAALLAFTCVVGVAVPAVEAWLNWAVLWGLGLGGGVTALGWVAREVAGEIGLARELHRHRPRPTATEQPDGTLRMDGVR